MAGKNISNPDSLIYAIKFFEKNEILQKSLGQNFLIDKNILNKIINVAQLKINLYLKLVLEQGISHHIY